MDRPSRLQVLIRGPCRRSARKQVVIAARLEVSPECSLFFISFAASLIGCTDHVTSAQCRVSCKTLEYLPTTTFIFTHAPRCEFITLLS